MSECEACRPFAADMRRIRDLAGSLDRLAPPDGLWLQVAGRLRQEGRVTGDAARRAAGTPPPLRDAGDRCVAHLAVGASLMYLFPMFETRNAPERRQSNGR